MSFGDKSGSVLAILLVAFSVRADEPSTSNEAIDRLIARLDSDSFAVRQNATDTLLDMGPAAFPALERATSNESLEATNRAFEILARQLQSLEDATRMAAKETLQRLAQGRNVLAARRAGDLLQPRPDPKNVDPNLLAFPAQRLLGNRIVINRRVPIVVQNRVQNQNGVKTTEFSDGDRKVKIVEDPNKGLEIELTEKKDGQETTKKFSAKDVAELKTKHPEAHKLYEQHAQNGLLPAARPPVEVLQRSIQLLEQHLERIKNLNLPEQHQKPLQEQLERMKKQLDEAQEEAKTDRAGRK